MVKLLIEFMKTGLTGGGKSNWKSLTVWGGIVWLGADTVVQAICGAGLLPAVCDIGMSFWANLGQVMMALGIARKPGISG